MYRGKLSNRCLMRIGIDSKALISQYEAKETLFTKLFKKNLIKIDIDLSNATKLDLVWKKTDYSIIIINPLYESEVTREELKNLLDSYNICYTSIVDIETKEDLNNYCSTYLNFYFYNNADDISPPKSYPFSNIIELTRRS